MKFEMKPGKIPRGKSKPWRKLFFAFTVVFFMKLGFAQGADEPCLISGPYLGRAASREITIIWRTKQKIVPRVAISPMAYSKETFPGKIREKIFSKDIWQYEAKISGLSPRTQYQYAVFDGPKQISALKENRNLTFWTAPEQGSAGDIHFFVVGDTGMRCSASEDVVMRSFEAMSLRGKPHDFFLHVGDIAYENGKDREFEKNYLGLYAPLINTVTGWPTPGNHDTHSSDMIAEEGPYFDVFVLPMDGESGGVASRREGYYAFDYGDLHVVSLDSNESDLTDTGPMANWLERDLASTKARWKVVFFHHAPYSLGRRDSNKEKEIGVIRTDIVPILERYGVDLVFSGHAHVYTRSYLLSGACGRLMEDQGQILDKDDVYEKADNKGTVYVIAGHGGGRKIDKAPKTPFTKVVVEECGFVDVDISDSVLTARMIDIQGNVRDSFSIVKKR